MTKKPLHCGDLMDLPWPTHQDISRFHVVSLSLDGYRPHGEEVEDLGLDAVMVGGTISPS